MYKPEIQQFYTPIIQQHIHPDLEVLDVKPIPGGCINNAQRLSTIKGEFFLKWNDGVPVDFFRKEFEGLNYLRKYSPLTIPKPIAVGKQEQIPYLLMEFIVPGKRAKIFWEDFGEKLGDLHRVTHETFGFYHQNYIGALKQFNEPEETWIDFFIKKRIMPQLKLAQSKKLIATNTISKFEILFQKLPEILTEEKPGLLHGDLWSGNVMIDAKGYACLLDPAVYYGNREIEIAFTQLFGGFDDTFYKAYFYNFPTAKGFEKRAEIYNLYPLLVHVNLFGGSYLSAVESVLKRYS